MIVLAKMPDTPDNAIPKNWEEVVIQLQEAGKRGGDYFRTLAKELELMNFYLKNQTEYLRQIRNQNNALLEIVQATTGIRITPVSPPVDEAPTQDSQGES